MARRRKARVDGETGEKLPRGYALPKQPPDSAKIRYTVAETRAQFAMVEQLLTNGYTLAAIRRAVSEKLGCTLTRVSIISRRVQDAWAVEMEDTRRSFKASQIRRIQRTIRQASGVQDEQGNWTVRPNYHALARFESLLADITGTREPLRVDLNVELRETLTAVVAQMDPQQSQEYLEAARRRQELAEHRARELGEVLPSPMGLTLTRRAG